MQILRENPGNEDRKLASEDYLMNKSVFALELKEKVLHMRQRYTEQNQATWKYKRLSGTTLMKELFALLMV